jgi:putative transposon-encoded protein
MKKVELQAQTHIEIDGIEGFFIRKVTKFSNSAKVDLSPIPRSSAAGRFTIQPSLAYIP